MNKKIMTVLASATVLASVMSLAACGPKQEPLTDKPLSGSALADFTQGEADAFFASDGWCNGDVFNVTWNEKNVSYANGAANLAVTDASSTAEIPYLGGELRSYQHFGYGDFSVTMKPAKIAGTASAFFTYTGPSELDEDENPNPHDEIDIEFLGKDTTKVQFNYFVNGEGGNEYMYDLGFDASLEYHEYGFRWTAEYIVWFVDGTPVYKVEASESKPLPSTAGRILMNHWCGTEEAEGWMGEYAGSNGVTASYKTVKTSATPIGEIPEAPEVPDVSEVPEEGWTDIDYSGFGGWSGYDIDKTDGLTISHDAAKKNWACEGMGLSDSYSWVRFNIKNNDENAASVRIDVKKDSGAGGVAGVICDSDAVKYDAVEAAAMLTLEGGKDVDVVLKIKDMYVDQFVVFLNSTSATEGVATGSITITDLQGIINEDVEAPEPVEPSEPEIPDGESTTLTFTPSIDKYNITAGEDGTVNVTYEGIMNTYDNIAAGISGKSEGSTTFTFTVKNNGENEVNLRVDMLADGTNVGTGISAVGGDAWQSDSSYFKVAAGATIVVTVTYEGTPDTLLLYIDTTIWEDVKVTEYAGDITIGNFIFVPDEATED